MLHEMPQWNLKPSLASCSLAIAACDSACEWQRALDIFRDMRNWGTCGVSREISLQPEDISDEHFPLTCHPSTQSYGHHRPFSRHRCGLLLSSQRKVCRFIVSTNTASSASTPAHQASCEHHQSPTKCPSIGVSQDAPCAVFVQCNIHVHRVTSVVRFFGSWLPVDR